MIVFHDDLPLGFSLCSCGCGTPTKNAGLCGICAAVTTLDAAEVDLNV